MGVVDNTDDPPVVVLLLVVNRGPLSVDIEVLTIGAGVDRERGTDVWVKEEEGRDVD